MTLHKLLIGSVFIASLSCCSGITHSTDGNGAETARLTLNEPIEIGAGSTIEESCKSLNGSITINNNSKVMDVSSVNGAIEIFDNVEVRGNVESVNGAIECGPDTAVNGDVGSINGSISLRATKVAGNVKTWNGDISLLQGSEVGGDLIVEPKPNKGSEYDTLAIRISDGSVVMGDLIVRDPQRSVTVYFSNGGNVDGEIRNAVVVNE